MAKDPDFGGGIPKKLLDEVVGLMVGATLPTGVSQGDAVNVLTHLLWEEHQAANPGPGVVGFWDASEALKELDAATENLKAATTPAAGAAAVPVLIKAIDGLTQLWEVGSVMPGFFTPFTPAK
jgi:hypothetical protein